MTRFQTPVSLALAILVAVSATDAGAQVQPAPPDVTGMLVASPPSQAAQAPLPGAVLQPQGRPGQIPSPLSQGGAAMASPYGAPGGARSAEFDQKRRDRAFQDALKQLNPLTPAQIKQYRQTDSDAKRAMTAPLSQGHPVQRAVRVTLRPGEMPPEIRVEPGLVSTMTFSDVTGQPWPVLSVVVGNPTAYVAQSAGEEGKSNIVVLSAVTQYVPSNIAVTLVGHPVPITMSLVQGQAETDFRVDVRVEAKGPNAAQDIVGVSSLAPTSDATMLQFLDGTPPPGALRLRTNYPDVDAWRFEDSLYLRTRGELLSPVYVARSNNVAGVNLFKMADSPIVLISQGGRTSSVAIRR